jgi:hypothetical protein
MLGVNSLLLLDRSEMPSPNLNIIIIVFLYYEKIFFIVIINV